MTLMLTQLIGTILLIIGLIGISASIALHADAALTKWKGFVAAPVMEVARDMKPWFAPNNTPMWATA